MKVVDRDIIRKRRELPARIRRVDMVRRTEMKVDDNNHHGRT